MLAEIAQRMLKDAPTLRGQQPVKLVLNTNPAKARSVTMGTQQIMQRSWNTVWMEIAYKLHAIFQKCQEDARKNRQKAMFTLHDQLLGAETFSTRPEDLPCFCLEWQSSDHCQNLSGIKARDTSFYVWLVETNHVCQFHHLRSSVKPWSLLIWGKWWKWAHLDRNQILKSRPCWLRAIRMMSSLWLMGFLSWKQLKVETVQKTADCFSKRQRQSFFLQQLVNRSWAVSPIARPVNTSKTPPQNTAKCQFRSLTQDSSLPRWKEKCSEWIQNENCNSATDESASAGMGPPKQQHLCKYLASINGSR